MSENPLERWPGYDEQSWQQRFAELDRRYKAQADAMGKVAQELNRLHSSRSVMLRYGKDVMVIPGSAREEAWQDAPLHS